MVRTDGLLSPIGEGRPLMKEKIRFDNFSVILLNSGASVREDGCTFLLFSCFLCEDYVPFLVSFLKFDTIFGEKFGGSDEIAYLCSV